MKKKFQNIIGVLVIFTMLFTSMGTGAFANVNDGVEGDVQATEAIDVQAAEATEATNVQAAETTETTDAQATEATEATDAQAAETTEATEAQEPVSKLQTEATSATEGKKDTVALMALAAPTESYSGAANALKGTLVWREDVTSIKILQGKKTLTGVKIDGKTVTVNGLDTTKAYTYEVTCGEEVQTGKLVHLPKIAAPTITSVNNTYKNATKDNITIKWKNRAGYNAGLTYEIWGGTNKLGTAKSTATSFSKVLTTNETKQLCNADSYDYKIVVKSGNVTATSKLFPYAAPIVTHLNWYAKAKKNTTVYKRAKGKAKLTSVKKGTAMKAIGKYPKKLKFWGVPRRVQVKLSNGEVGWVAWGAVKMIPHVKDHNVFSYSDKAITDFVQGYSSPSKYLILVNRYNQRTYVFKGKKGNWKLSKNYKCTTANFYQPLTKGVTVLKKHVKRVNKVHKSGKKYYYNWATKFRGSGYFHPRCRWSSSNKLRNSIKTTPSTKGCVRLYDGAAKFIYSMPLGTTAVLK